MGKILDIRMSILPTVSTFTLPMGWKGTPLPRPPLVYPFNVPEFAAVSPGPGLGADPSETVGVALGEEENVVSNPSSQLLTAYLAKLFVLLVKVGAQAPPNTNRWRMSSAELPFSP